MTENETSDVKLASAPLATNGPNPLAEQVYQQLKEDIFSFRLFPGDRFSESDIAQHYGVSRTPMRDGLFRLQREGYLEVGFRRGWKVSQINFEQLDQLYDLRIVLELAALERLTSGNAPHEAIEPLTAVGVFGNRDFTIISFAMNRIFRITSTICITTRSSTGKHAVPICIRIRLLANGSNVARMSAIGAALVTIGP